MLWHSRFPLVVVLLLAAAGPLSAEKPPDLTGGSPASGGVPLRVALCARVGLLQSSSGGSITFGRHSLPPLWSLRRDVRFQACAPDGTPLPASFRLEVRIEPLTPEIGAENAMTTAVETDGQGRFSGVYGAGRRGPGAPWLEGFNAVELHHFLLEGRTIATFVLERSASDVRFYRR